jgi:hypothetical protein
MDESACNYEEGFTVSAPETCGYINFELTIQPDNYPEDVAWSMTLPNDTVVTGNLSLTGTDLFTETFCYVPGCYTFNITDSFGDGLLSGGYYTIESPFGTVFAQGGEYEFFETSGFCSIPYGCTDETACNYDCEAIEDDGNCTYANAGYDCDDECLVDSDGDGVCDQDEVTDCQDEAACNYEESATDEGYCHYAETNYDCDGNCINDTDSDGVCDALEVAGCTTPSACNYDAAATEDDGNCTYADAGYDCAGNCLFDSDGDDICDWIELEALTEALTAGIYCGDGTLWVEAAQACLPMEMCVGDLDGDGIRGTGDLLIFLGFFGTDCE